MTFRSTPAHITLSIFNFRGQVVVEQCAYTLPMRYHITHAHYGSTKGVLNTQHSFVPRLRSLLHAQLRNMTEIRSV